LLNPTDPFVSKRRSQLTPIAYPLAKHIHLHIFDNRNIRYFPL